MNDIVPTLTNYISFENKDETGDLSDNDYVFRLKNNTDNYPNSYNASSFLTRTNSYSSDEETDLFSADFATNYSDNFDLLLVARYNTDPNFKKESFFSGGNIIIGNGDDNKDCEKKHYMIKGTGGTLYCGHNSDALLDNKVEIDNDFHRFRVKYTSATNAVEFYIDGHLIQPFNEIMSINRFGLFINNGDKFAPHAAMSFIGLFKNHLSDSDFERFDQFLACKFELQP